MPEIRLKSWIPTDASAANLIELIQRAERKALDVILPELRRVDGFGDAQSNLSAADAEFARWISDQMIGEVVTSTGGQARARADAGWAAQIGRALGQPVALDTRPQRELLERWVSENVERIGGLREETRRRMAADIETAIRSGARPEELAASWERNGLPTVNGNLRGRAMVIARDQLGKLAAQLAQAQAQGLGLDDYLWDDRPGIPRDQRPRHRARRGIRYQWASPPQGGHPGTEVSCYCGATTVVSIARLREIESGLPPLKASSTI